MIAAVSEELGHNVAILDVNAFRIGLDAIRQEIRSDEWDVIGIGGLTSQYKYIKPISKICKEIQPDALLVAGGGFLTSQPKEMLNWLPFDVGVVGEGERTWEELLEHVYDRRFKKVKGIVYRKSKLHLKYNEKGVLKSPGKIVMNPPRPLIPQEELDELPYPAYDLLPLEVYFQNSALALSPESMLCKRRLDIISERGCIHKCRYCQHLGMSSWDLGRIHHTNVKGPAIRFQSARYVVNLMKYLRFKYSCDFFSILDENFFANRKRVLEICDLMEQEDLVGLVKWGALGSVDVVDYQVLQRAKDCGCTYVSYGGESASQRVLKSLNKGWQTPERMQAALDATRKAGITPIMTFMISAADNVESIIETTEFWIRNGIICKPFFETAYPGTQLFDMYKDEILKQYNGDLEAFVLKCGDATELIHNLSKGRFTDVELLGLRELMFTHDVKRLKEFAKLKGEKIGGETDNSK